MTTNTPINLWASSDHVRDYLGRADSIAHRGEGEAALLEFIPANARCILDLGTGDGRLLALVKSEMASRDNARGGGSKSKPWQSIFRLRCSKLLESFAGDSSVMIVTHNLIPLPDLGKLTR